MSPAHDQGYLCEGIAEELITALSQVAGLRVAARTASFHFRQTGGDVREIAQTPADHDVARRQRTEG